MTTEDEEFERQVSARQRFFKAPELHDGDIEPPTELDRIVLAKAREAIRVSEPARVYRNPRWVVPVGLAATVVIGFAVALVTPWGSERAQLTLEESAAPASSTATVSTSVAVDADAAFAPPPPPPPAPIEAPVRAPAPISARSAAPAVPAAPVAAMSAASEAESDAANDKSAKRELPASPEAWWEHIQELREAGRWEEAEQERKALRRLFPDFRPPQPAQTPPSP